MKTLLCLPLFTVCTLSLVFAENTFSIGNDVFLLEFEHKGYSMSFQTFVAEDVGRVFLPLQNISNVVNTATLLESSETTVGLTSLSGYPVDFAGSFSVSNKCGQLIFTMGNDLSERYVQAYTEYESKSNQVAQLNALLDSINSGAITNSPAEAFLTLVFLPDGFGADVTPDKARNLILSSLEHAPISASILDYWEQTVDGEPRLMAASKTVVADALETTLEPICWIYLNESWKFCHPAILRYSASVVDVGGIRVSDPVTLVDMVVTAPDGPANAATR
jgi:hypothetical protein